MRDPLAFLPEYIAPIEQVSARAFKIPTPTPEADGTIAWDSTVLVLATIKAGSVEGLGYSYASRAAVCVIEDTLSHVIAGLNAFDIPHCWRAMCESVRNIGRSGVAACAISAVDNALWDAKAKLMGVTLTALLGKSRNSIPVYGSGGFTTYDGAHITKQIEHWQQHGIKQFKIKIGRDEIKDAQRIRSALDTLQPGEKLFVDANGAYTPKQALRQAERMAEHDIAWFEEPVSSDDNVGLRFVRDHAPACMEIAAGEYGYNADDFCRLLECGGAVDTLQADATRCLGLTGFLQAAHLASAHHRPLSSHCAPGLHASVMCHIENAVHSEYFSDHARIEQLLFDGVPEVIDGYLTPQNERPGFGFALKLPDAEKYAI